MSSKKVQEIAKNYLKSEEAVPNHPFKNAREILDSKLEISYKEMKNYLSSKELEKSFFQQLELIVKNSELSSKIFITFKLEQGDKTPDEIQELVKEDFIKSDILSVKCDKYLGSYFDASEQKVTVVCVDISHI